MKTETEKYARQCDVTGEGMNEGYCIQDGLMYIKYEKDLLKHLREVEKEGNPEYDTLVAKGRLTDVLLLDEYYDAEYYLWTDWYDDIEYAENMAIIENNKLIAEFMGMKLGQDHTNDNMYYDDAENLHPPTPIDELKFHTSWDWLMPVVEKIESYNASVTINGLYSVFNKKVGHQVTIRIEAVEMNEGGNSAWVLEDEYLHHSDIKDSKIEAVYQAVVEFINQINK